MQIPVREVMSFKLKQTLNLVIYSRDVHLRCFLLLCKFLWKSRLNWYEKVLAKSTQLDEYWKNTYEERRRFFLLKFTKLPLIINFLKKIVDQIRGPFEIKLKLIILKAFKNQLPLARLLLLSGLTDNENRSCLEYQSQ